MKRTTISLPDDLAMILEREARRRHASVSQVTREALAGHFGLESDRPRKLGFAGLGRSGQSNVAGDMEELLEREWNDPGDS
jgi:hypothetical protein